MNTAMHLVNHSPGQTSRAPGCAGHLFLANLRGRMACLLLALGATMILAQPCGAAPGEWEFTGSLNTGRSFHTATKLLDGRVLVAGGKTDLASCELYDPATGIWSFTGSLNNGRYYHTATLLLSGKVLVAGGYTAGSDSILTAELYDPQTGTWTITGSPGRERYNHAATLLADGRVMIVGGLNPGTILNTTQLYDPAVETWSQTDKLNISRSYHTATLLTDGKVLVAGGEFTPGEATDTEIWDPTTGIWTLTGALNHGRSAHTATLLSNGKVLVAGGSISNGFQMTYASCELFDPSTGIWTDTGDMNTARYEFTATLLPNGLVLVAAGIGEGLTNLASAELYNPTSETWSVTGILNIARNNHGATLLDNGMVLVEGGSSSDDTSAELYNAGIIAATQASGRGSIDGQGDSATFNFHAKSGDRVSGSLTFSDVAAGISISKAKVRTLTFNGGNSADLGGNARLGDGSKVTYSVSLTDNGNGSSSDTFTISLSNGYSAGGTLTSGDIRIY